MALEFQSYKQPVNRLNESYDIESKCKFGLEFFALLVKPYEISD